MSARKPTPTRELPAQTERVETGPVRFGGDWTGAFIRGDDAFYYALNLRDAMLKCADDPLVNVALQSLLNVLESCDERREREEQGNG